MFERAREVTGRRGLTGEPARVDRLGEDRRLPQGERLVPRQARQIEARPVPVARREVGPRGEAGLPGHRGEVHDRARMPPVGVRREEVPEIGERIPERRHLPVEDRRDGDRRMRRDHRVARPIVAVDDGMTLRVRAVRLEPGAEAADRRQRTPGVLLPQGGEERDLSLEVALGSAESGDLRHGDVDVVEGRQLVDERLAEPTAPVRGLEDCRQGVGDDSPGHEVHEVERHAEDGFVLTDVDDRRHRDALPAEHGLDPRLADHVMGRARDRRPRPAPEHDVDVVAADPERDVRLALPDPLPPHGPGADAARIEVIGHRVEDEQRRGVEFGGLGRGLDDIDELRGHRATSAVAGSAASGPTEPGPPSSVPAPPGPATRSCRGAPAATSRRRREDARREIANLCVSVDPS